MHGQIVLKIVFYGQLISFLHPVRHNLTIQAAENLIMWKGRGSDVVNIRS